MGEEACCHHRWRGGRFTDVSLSCPGMQSERRLMDHGLLIAHPAHPRWVLHQLAHSISVGPVANSDPIVGWNSQHGEAATEKRLKRVPCNASAYCDPGPHALATSSTSGRSRN